MPPTEIFRRCVSFPGMNRLINWQTVKTKRIWCWRYNMWTNSFRTSNGFLMKFGKSKKVERVVFFSTKKWYYHFFTPIDDWMDMESLLLNIYAHCWNSKFSYMNFFTITPFPIEYIREVVSLPIKSCMNNTFFLSFHFIYKKYFRFLRFFIRHKKMARPSLFTKFSSKISRSVSSPITTFSLLNASAISTLSFHNK